MFVFKLNRIEANGAYLTRRGCSNEWFYALTRTQTKALKRFVGCWFAFGDSHVCSKAAHEHYYWTKIPAQSGFDENLLVRDGIEPILMACQKFTQVIPGKCGTVTVFAPNTNGGIVTNAIKRHIEAGYK